MGTVVNQFTKMVSASDPPQRGEEALILASWRRNAAPWTAAVRGGAIASRQRVTDGAIVEAVLARQPRSVLDVGCGEGWLARTLSARGVDVTGIDATPELVEQARRSGGGTYRVMEYGDLASGALRQRFDVVVCNFSLLGRESSEAAVGGVPELLGPDGRLLIQTLHPSVVEGESGGEGWRNGSWAGCGSGFSDPAPWYFRTLDGWLGLLERSGLQSVGVLEPRDADSPTPASLILVAASRT